MRLSLSQRILLITLAALAPLALALAYNEVALRRSREAELRSLALATASQAAKEMEQLTSGADGILHALASAPPVRSFDRQSCDAYLARVEADLPQLTNIGVFDAQGDVACRSNPDPRPLNVADRPYFREALAANGHMVVGEYTVGRLNGRKSLPLALAFRDEAGRNLGVIATALDLDWLGRSIRERDLAKNASLTIADRNGVIVAREPFPERFVGTTIPDAFLPLVNADRPGALDVTSQDGTKRILGYIPAKVPPAGLYVSAGIARDEAFAAVNAATRRTLMLGLIAAGAAALLSWYLGQKLVRGPVARIAATLSARRAGDEVRRTGMRAGDGELEALGAEFDLYMDEINARRAERLKADEHQRLLVNELNHRVKNTLATVQSIASQTLRQGGSAADARAAVESRLAALARAHDMLTRENWESADLRRVAEDALAPFGGARRNRLHIEGPTLRLPPRMVLSLAMALQELATNALKYGALSKESGEVRLTWGEEAAASERRLRLAWTESGGPSVREPTRRGFGTRLIEDGLAKELDGIVALTYRPQGLVCTIDAPIA